MHSSGSETKITALTLKVNTIRAITRPLVGDGTSWWRWTAKSYTRSMFFLKNQSLFEKDKLIFDLVQQGAFESEIKLKSILMGDYGFSDFDKIFDQIYYRVMAFKKASDLSGMKKSTRLKVVKKK